MAKGLRLSVLALGVLASGQAFAAGGGAGGAGQQAIQYEHRMIMKSNAGQGDKAQGGAANGDTNSGQGAGK